MVFYVSDGMQRNSTFGRAATCSGDECNCIITPVLANQRALKALLAWRVAYSKENSLDHGRRLLVRWELIKALFICPTIVQSHNTGVPMKRLRHSLIPKLKTTAWKKGKDITSPPPRPPAAVTLTLGAELQWRVIQKTISYAFTSEPEKTEMLDECWPSADLNSQCPTLNIRKKHTHDPSYSNLDLLYVLEKLLFLCIIFCYIDGKVSFNSFMRDTCALRMPVKSILLFKEGVLALSV